MLLRSAIAISCCSWHLFVSAGLGHTSACLPFEYPPFDNAHWINSQLDHFFHSSNHNPATCSNASCQNLPLAVSDLDSTHFHTRYSSGFRASASMESSTNHLGLSVHDLCPNRQAFCRAATQGGHLPLDFALLNILVLLIKAFYCDHQPTLEFFCGESYWAPSRFYR